MGNAFEAQLAKKAERTVVREVTPEVAQEMGRAGVEAIAERHGSATVTEPLAPAWGPGGYKSAKVGTIISCPPEHLKDNPYNARRFYTQKTISCRQTSIELDGQLEPIYAFVDEDGGLVIEDGHFRKKALLSSGKQAKVLIVDRPLTAIESYRRSRLHNAERKTQSALDDAFQIKRLLDSGVAESQAELGKILGITAPDMTRLLKLAEIPELVASAASEAEETSSAKFLYALYQYLGAVRDTPGKNGGETSDVTEIVNKGYEIIREAQSRGLSANELERRTKSLRRPQSRPRAQVTVITFAKGKGQLKSFPTKKRVTLDVEVREDEDLEYVIGRLRGALEATSVRAAKSSQGPGTD